MRRIVLFSILLFFVSGCLQAPPQELEESPFTGGTEGLVMNFIEGAPPERLLIDDVFQIAVFASNKGETDIPAGEAVFILSDTGQFSIDNSKRTNVDEPIRGSAKLAEGQVIPGEVITVIYSDAQHTGTRPGTGETPKPISVSVFYPYESRAISSLCLSKSRTDVICEVPGETDVVQTSYSSGAPVVVTEVKQITSTYNALTGTSDVSFSVEVQNMGNGDVYDILSDVDSREGRHDLIKVSEMAFGEYEWLDDGDDVEFKCGFLKDAPGYFIVGSEGGRFQCTIFNVPTDSDFMESLTMKFEYNYWETVKTSISFITFEV